MTVWSSIYRYHAVGIHVSQGPETVIFQPNGRVNLSVHLRNLIKQLYLTGFSTVWHCFSTVWHWFGTVYDCFDLRMMDIDLRMMDIDLRMMDMGPWIWDPGTGYGTLVLDMGPWYWLWTLDIPWVGPWQYHTGPTPGIPLHHPGYTPPLPTHPARRTESTNGLRSTLSPFCQNCC